MATSLDTYGKGQTNQMLRNANRKLIVDGYHLFNDAKGVDGPTKMVGGSLTHKNSRMRNYNYDTNRDSIGSGKDSKALNISNKFDSFPT